MDQRCLFGMAQWKAASGSSSLIKQLIAGATYESAQRQTFSRKRKSLMKSEAWKQTQGFSNKHLKHE